MATRGHHQRNWKAWLLCLLRLHQPPAPASFKSTVCELWMKNANWQAYGGDELGTTKYITSRRGETSIQCRGEEQRLIRIGMWVPQPQCTAVPPSASPVKQGRARPLLQAVRWPQWAQSCSMDGWTNRCDESFREEVLGACGHCSPAVDTQSPQLCALPLSAVLLPCCSPITEGPVYGSQARR